MISNGLCLMKGQHPDSNKISIIFSLLIFSNAGILCLIAESFLSVKIVISNIYLRSPLTIFSIFPCDGETNLIFSFDLE